MISLRFFLTTNSTVKESFSRSKTKTTKPKLFFRTEPSSYSKLYLKILMITTKPKVIFLFFFPNGTMILQWVKLKKMFFSNIYDLVLLLTMMVTNSKYDSDEFFSRMLFFLQIKCKTKFWIFRMGYIRNRQP